jgi:uncharacterized membrane protein
MNIGKWLRVNYKKITGSIAFIPAIIAVCFLILSLIMLEIDFSEGGKNLKASLSWLSLKDASTARSIIATVAGAIISLTVFSFSMVMIVLNQAASQMSNRVLSSMIENRFQQIVLGFYIGTIVYALFLLTTIRDINSGVSVPALSIYLLILLTVIDIFLFIYFLDYVTQTVKYETVIHRVQKKTMATMKKNFTDRKDKIPDLRGLVRSEIKVVESDYYQGFDEKKVLQIAVNNGIRISFLFNESTYLIKGTVFMIVYGETVLTENDIKKLLSAIDFYKGQPIERNADYGFRQLTEVAIKALSPGINDPATAVTSLHALSDLFAYRLYYHAPLVIYGEDGLARIEVKASTFSAIFDECIQPIWNYGKTDQYIQKQLNFMIDQLKKADHEKKYHDLFDSLIDKIKIQTSKSDC